MKTEMRRITRQRYLHHFLSRRSMLRVSIFENRYVKRCLSVIVSLMLIAVMHSCSSIGNPYCGSGTSTEVVGKIVAPDNKAVEGVQVLLFDTLVKGTNCFIDTIADTTDKNGNFTLRVDSSGLYLLKVKDTIGRSYMDEVIVSNDTPSLSLGVLKVDTMGSLNGFILDNTNFKANITVILYKKDMPFMYLWRRGAFSIDSLAPGDVRIQIGGWIDDYSRVNKWIIFFDSTIQILPGRKTVLDTVFINEETLNKADGLSMSHDQGPEYASVFMSHLVSVEDFYPRQDCILPISDSPVINRLYLPTNSITHLFMSEKPAGAAAFRFAKSDIYAVSDAT